MNRSLIAWTGVAALLVLTAAPASAQDPVMQPGLWVSGGAGYATGSYSCDACTDRDIGGLTGVLGAGWTPNVALSLGVEVAGGSTNENGVTDRNGQVLLIAEWHPAGPLGPYVGGGAGLARWETSIEHADGGEDELGRTGLGISARAGWVIAMSHSLSIRPQVAWVMSPTGTVGDTGLEAGQSLWRGDVSVRWHFGGP